MVYTKLLIDQVYLEKITLEDLSMTQNSHVPT